MHDVAGHRGSSRNWRTTRGSRSALALYLNLETDLDNLGGRNAKIRGRQIGVEVHRGEQGFSPGRQAGGVAGAGWRSAV
jgi:hypothetical protein